MTKTATRPRSRSKLSILKVEVPRALKPLLQPARYKGAHGGRGGAKSHFFAEQLVLRCYGQRTRAVCIREVQNSLKESVRQLLIDKIMKFGLGAHFEVLESEIRCPRTGSLVVFKGMQSYNAENIKSLEDFDVAWVEEAQTLSEKSLRLLRPTIRREGSELWFSWNARYDSDPVDKFFRGGEPPPDSICVSVGWQDNPWFPDVLKQEMRFDYTADPEMAEHVWGGGYEIISEGSYYARLLATIETDGRLGHFPYDPDYPLDTAWDIGVDDYTAIWFIQNNGVFPWVVDYYECSGNGPQQIVPEMMPELLPDINEAAARLIELGRNEPYRYNTHFFPHDIGQREWGAGGRDRALSAMALGIKPIYRGVRLGPESRIEATRQLLPITKFDNNPRVMNGVSRMRRYRRRFNETLQVYGVPLKDGNDHGADAFGEYAINCGIVPETPRTDMKPAVKRGQVYLPGPPEPRKSTRIRV